MADFCIKSDEFYLLQLGHEFCLPKKSQGPMSKKNYLFHYILEGKGKFVSNGRQYLLKSGQGFLITYEDLIYYEADEEDPWHYAWFEFDGDGAVNFLKLCGLDSKKPIYTCSNHEAISECFMTLIDTFSNSDNFFTLGVFYTLLGNLLKYNPILPKNEVKSESDYINTALNYIKVNYQKKITVKELCDLVRINRSYFCKLFTSYTGSSPQKYIIKSKLNYANQLLAETKLSITEVARSVGYDDVSTFSKLYKHYNYISPQTFRKNLN